MRVQDDLGVYEIPGGDSLVQSFAKSSGSRHDCVFRGTNALSKVFIQRRPTPGSGQALKEASRGDKGI